MHYPVVPVFVLPVSYTHLDVYKRQLVDMEIRELLNEYEFPGDDTPIIQGSALKALEDPSSEWGDKIMELMDAVDSWIPDPQRATDQPFLMPVEDVFTITGRGTVATGRVERGVLHLNEEVEIVGIKEETRKTVVTLSLIHIYRRCERRYGGRNGHDQRRDPGYEGDPEEAFGCGRRSHWF